MEDILVVHRQNEINEHPPIEATTTMNLLAAENTKQIKEDSNDENETLKGMDEKCILEVFSTELMNGPPPAYSLTNPCLPPNSLREQDWPSISPLYFDGYPPYPAGPPLLKVAYPKDIPGPTYACPKCDGRFLYYRPAGIVQCPFCHSAISIGRYVCLIKYFG
ncbi:unnamed protein product [Cercopithifilaria johnstoni]|uniref:Phosphatidylinositol-4,5-bisphosphate 4-phosphatase n=1 Tax=Cercopithifilaria johnstoni TaxID=2874296 RepID=A0A8J2Q9M5_9BILA|nr:unnamed protein product [Cercopithifilaria johnstoni]